MRQTRTISSYTSAHVAINVDCECNKFSSYSLNAAHRDYEHYTQMVRQYFVFTFTCILDEIRT
jgi:hypothetical protein